MVIKLQDKLKQLVKKKDMRLDIFINNAIYNKNGYYYKINPLGKDKDFVTAPEISQMFGEIIGLYLFYIWKTKINSKFNLIELGPGKGTLLNDIVNSVSNYPDFLKKANINLIEINKELIKIQKKNIFNSKISNVKWSKKINFKSKNPSIIYSNEFFDCFPVRQFIFNNCWYEKYVSFNKNNNNFFLKDKLVNNKKILSSLKLYEKEKILEISNERNDYFNKICEFIKKNGGLFFTIDYGYFTNIHNFTIQAIQNHRYSHVLENIGEKDISSHVNFRDFLDIAKKNNLHIEECCSQREFLIKYGIEERQNKLSNLKNRKNINIEMKRLIDNNEMGNLFKCLVVSNL